MASGIPVTDEFFRPGVEILLTISNTLSKRWRKRGVQDFYAAPRANGGFDAVERRSSILPTRTDRPHLARGQGISVDAFIAMQLRSRHELFDTLDTHEITEMRVPEFGLETTFLLFLDAPAG